MSLLRLLSLTVLLVLANSFAKNCQAFNSNNFNYCLTCTKGYYLINGLCFTCPTNKNTIKQCSQPSGQIATASPSVENAKAANADNSVAPTNKAENILANAFGQASGAIAIKSAPNSDAENRTAATQNGSNSTQTNTNGSTNTNLTSTISLTSNQNTLNTSNKTTQTASSSSNSSSSANATNSTQTPEKTSFSPNSPPASTTTNTPSSSTSPVFTPPQATNDLSQIIFKYLPPHCCQFSVTPVIACIACEPNYVLTSNNTCQPTSPTQNIQASTQNISSQSINASASTSTDAVSPLPQTPSPNPPPKALPSNLKVTASLPSPDTTSLPIVVIDPPASLINKNPQPIFIPITTTTPQTDNVPQPQNTEQNANNPQTTQPKYISVQVNPPPKTQTTPSNAVASVVMPRKGLLKDPNCLQVNQNFDLFKPVSIDNVRCSCYKGFYYDLTKEICLPLNPLCKNVTSQNQCTACYMGYVLIRGNCLINNGQYQVISATSLPINSQQDPNCQTYQPNSTICSVCSNRYYFNLTKNLCVQVDSSCKSWNQTNGYCTQCYTGYRCGPNDKICKPIPPLTPSNSPNGIQSYTSFCTKTVRNKCTACAYRFFLSNGLCLPVSDQCNTFNPNFGYCLSCYSGYVLNDGVCEEEQTPIVSSDANCAIYTHQGCQACNVGYFVNSQGWCQMVSSLCNGYNPQNGYCLACTTPYTLDPTTGQCLYYP